MAMDGAELARWTRFAAKGGIGSGTALKDCIAEGPQDLMFMKDDEVVFLMQLPQEGRFLGYCEGVVGHFSGTDVQLHGKLKRAVFTRRSTSAQPAQSTSRPQSQSPQPQHPPTTTTTVARQPSPIKSKSSLEAQRALPLSPTLPLFAGREGTPSPLAYIAAQSHAHVNRDSLSTPPSSELGTPEGVVQRGAAEEEAPLSPKAEVGDETEGGQEEEEEDEEPPEPAPAAPPLGLNLHSPAPVHDDSPLAADPPSFLAEEEDSEPSSPLPPPTRRPRPLGILGSPLPSPFLPSSFPASSSTSSPPPTSPPPETTSSATRLNLLSPTASAYFSARGASATPEASTPDELVYSPVTMEPAGRGFFGVGEEVGAGAAGERESTVSDGEFGIGLSLLQSDDEYDDEEEEDEEEGEDPMPMPPSPSNFPPPLPTSPLTPIAIPPAPTPPRLRRPPLARASTTSSASFSPADIYDSYRTSAAWQSPDLGSVGRDGWGDAAGELLPAVEIGVGEEKEEEEEGRTPVIELTGAEAGLGIGAGAAGGSLAMRRGMGAVSLLPPAEIVQVKEGGEVEVDIKSPTTPVISFTQADADPAPEPATEVYDLTSPHTPTYPATAMERTPRPARSFTAPLEGLVHGTPPPLAPPTPSPTRSLTTPSSRPSSSRTSTLTLNLASSIRTRVEAQRASAVLLTPEPAEQPSTPGTPGTPDIPGGWPKSAEAVQLLTPPASAPFQASLQPHPSSAPVTPAGPSAQSTLALVAARGAQATLRGHTQTDLLSAFGPVPIAFQLSATGALVPVPASAPPRRPRSQSFSNFTTPANGIGGGIGKGKERALKIRMPPGPLTPPIRSPLPSSPLARSITPGHDADEPEQSPKSARRVLRKVGSPPAEEDSKDKDASPPLQMQHSRSASLRSKISMQAIKAKALVRGAGEDHTVQVEDAEFELVRPALALARIPSTNTSDEGGTSESASASSPTSAKLPLSTSMPGTPTSPPAASSAPGPVHTSPAAIEAHRALELRWIALMSSVKPAGARKQKKVRRMVWEGVPASVRGLVWAYLMDARARRLPGLFEKLVGRGRVPASAQIARDLDRLFPDQPHLRDADGSLVRLLQAYLCMVPDVQYERELALIAGNILSLSPEEDAFWTFVAVVDNHVRRYFTLNALQLEVDAALFVKAAEMADPGLAKLVFEQCGVSANLLCKAWFGALFCGVLPFSHLQRVWDVYLLDGVSFLFRTGLVILSAARRHLQAPSTFPPSALSYLTHPPPEILDADPDAFIARVTAAKLKEDDLKRLRPKVEAQLKQQHHPRPAGLVSRDIIKPPTIITIHDRAVTS